MAVELATPARCFPKSCKQLQAHEFAHVWPLLFLKQNSIGVLTQNCNCSCAPRRLKSHVPISDPIGRDPCSPLNTYVNESSKNGTWGNTITVNANTQKAQVTLQQPHIAAACTDKLLSRECQNSPRHRGCPPTVWSVSDSART